MLIHSTGTAWSLWKEDKSRIRWCNSNILVVLAQESLESLPESRPTIQSKIITWSFDLAGSIWPIYAMLISYVSYISGMMEPPWNIPDIQWGSQWPNSIKKDSQFNRIGGTCIHSFYFRIPEHLSISVEISQQTVRHIRHAPWSSTLGRNGLNGSRSVPEKCFELEKFATGYKT